MESQLNSKECLNLLSSTSSTNWSFYEKIHQHKDEEQSCLADIKLSTKIAWSWCMYNRGVRHTAIVLYLDDKPKFTINWSPKNKIIYPFRFIKYFTDYINEVDGEISFAIESEKSDITYKAPIPLEDKAQFYEKLKSFPFYKYPNSDSRGNAEKYELFGCNCRDHVEAVLCSVLRDTDLMLLQDHLLKIDTELRDHGVEKEMNRIVDKAAHNELLNYLRFGKGHPSDLVPRKAKIAAGRVFRRYYTLVCHCQPVGIFDPSLDTMGQWREKILDTYEVVFEKDIRNELDEQYEENAEDINSHSLSTLMEMSRNAPQQEQKNAIPLWIANMDNGQIIHELPDEITLINRLDSLHHSNHLSQI